MDQYTYDSRIMKRRGVQAVIIVAIISIVSIICFLLSRYTYITIENSQAESVNVLIKNGDAEDTEEDGYTRDFTLRNHETKRLFVRKDLYVIQADAASKTSVYYVNPRSLSMNHISLSTQKAQKSLVIGQSQYDCSTSKSPNDESVTFLYPCNNYTGTLSLIRDNQKTDIYSTLFQNQITPDHTHAEDSSSEADHHTPQSLSIKPYLNSLAGFMTSEDKLVIEQIDQNGSMKDIVSLPANGAEITNNSSVATDKFGVSEKIALFNSISKEIIIYKNLSDNHPEVVDISNYMKDSDLQDFQLLLSDDIVYFIPFLNIEAVEHHDNNGAQEFNTETKQIRKNQKIVKINLDGDPRIESKTFLKSG